MKFALIGLALLAALPAHAQFRKPEDAVKFRQGVMYAMTVHHDNLIGRMAMGRAPFDPKAAQESADFVVVLSKMPWLAFTPDTDGVGRTDAKSAIWTEQAKFKDLADKTQAEALKLQAAARTGDLNQLRAAYRASAAACKSCHDAFTNQ
jgi:cytochrome c556